MHTLWPRRLIRGLIIVVLLPSFGLCALLYSQQGSLLYPADPDLILAATANAFPHRNDVRAYLHAPASPARGTIVLFHGNAGTAIDRQHFADALNALGYRVLLAEYPGYGGRPGTPSEATLVADARQILQLASERFPEPLFVWGESLGAAVAAAAVAEGKPRVHGVMLITPWNTLADVANTHYPYLPVRWLLRDRYDSSANLRDYSGRVAIVVAEQDRVIPPILADRLYTQHPGEKRRWRFAGAGHNDWLNAADQAWWGEVMRYLDPP